MNTVIQCGATPPRFVPDEPNRNRRRRASGARSCGRGLVVLLACGLGLFCGDARAGEDPVLPVVLTRGHLDLAIAYRADAEWPLSLQLVDGDSVPPRRFAATNVVLQIPENARRELPADIPPLGGVGDPIWLLSASPSEEVPFLGISAEGMAASGLTGAIQFRLLGAEGPGAIFLWQAEAGALTFWMNSRDGYGPEDQFAQPVGGHSHANWGFSEPGVYRLTLQASGRRVGDSTPLLSEPTPVTFHVLPLPPPAKTPFERWCEVWWPGQAGGANQSPDADPDGDGRCNLLEYAQDTDPTVVDPTPTDWMKVQFERAGAEFGRAGVRFRRPTSATDLEVHLLLADEVSGPWTRVESLRVTSGEEDRGMLFESLWDPRPPGAMTSGWYRLGFELKASSLP